MDADVSYIAGLYERSRASPYYLFMIVMLLGCSVYALALLIVLHRWIGSGSTPLAYLVGLEAVNGQLTAKPANAETALALAPQPIRDAAVIFPAVGFIGTVVGVSLAIGGLNAVLDSGETTPLLDGLRIAFDTTLIGLMASVILSVLLYLIQMRVGLLLASVTSRQDVS
ncbi:MAG: MotA/TolQ/ExbB proton channel family protein [Pseudomonadota bacterium]